MKTVLFSDRTGTLGLAGYVKQRDYCFFTRLDMGAAVGGLLSSGQIISAIAELSEAKAEALEWFCVERGKSRSYVVIQVLMDSSRRVAAWIKMPDGAKTV